MLQRSIFTRTTALTIKFFVRFVAAHHPALNQRKSHYAVPIVPMPLQSRKTASFSGCTNVLIPNVHKFGVFILSEGIYFDECADKKEKLKNPFYRVLSFNFCPCYANSVKFLYFSKLLPYLVLALTQQPVWG